MRIYQAADYKEMSEIAARIMMEQIKNKPDSVLGLATGASPEGIYANLAAAYQNGELDFSKISTVNLDEYKGVSANHPNSYAFYMNKHLFSKVNLDKTRTHLPENDEDKDVCGSYERLIADLGGIDMQLLGIGVNGHIGFNEPEEKFSKETHLVTLTESTRSVNQVFFADDEEVPKEAYTMGIGTIMQAKKIILIANGPKKAEILKQALFGAITPTVPASVLQLHHDVTIVADKESLRLCNLEEEMKKSQIAEVCEHFFEDTKGIKCEPYGNGHINDTYLLRFASEKRLYDKLILQKMNRQVFKEPEKVMENITCVTKFLKDKIIAQGGDEKRETMTVLPSLDGKAFYQDYYGEYWRVYTYIENAVCYERVDKPELFYESGVAFGNFQKMLSDYPAEKLHETIPAFHDTRDRFCKFKKALEEDVCQRVKTAEKEIAFLLAHEKDTSFFAELLEKGEIPLRVTHNDTKLNNIMMDDKSGKGICVIDLDTVMPGLAVFDFGDAIRFGANTAAEDEKDLSKVSLDLELYHTYLKGFLAGAGNCFTEREMELLPMGAKMMALECGMRFLTDYLQGDTYFKIHRDGHNLDRCRTQFALVSDMETKWKEMSYKVS